MKNIIIILWALFTFILVSCSGEDSKVEIAKLNHQIDSISSLLIECESRVVEQAEIARIEAERARMEAQKAQEEAARAKEEKEE